jgi:hypothetical protein
VADTAICTGVGIIFLLSWNRSPEPPGPLAAETSPSDRP